MTVHLRKLCVGVDHVDQLAAWQARRLAAAQGRPGALYHQTRFHPRRRDEVLDGGSLYWIIRGVIRVRQRITGIEDAPVAGGDPEMRARPACRLMLDPVLVPVEPRAHRPFQGWRYLEPADAPADLARGDGQAEMPAEMAAELKELGLI